MDNIKDDNYYVKKIIENIDLIIEHTKEITKDKFLSDEVLVHATLFWLIQMIENVKGLSTDYKEKHNKVQWNQIIGFRNRIVHEYGNTNYSIIYEIINSDIYNLKKMLENG